MPKIREIVDIMERLAPSCTQADFDNSGFQVGNLDANTEKVLCALELEHWVIEEAERPGGRAYNNPSSAALSSIKKYNLRKL